VDLEPADIKSGAETVQRAASEIEPMLDGIIDHLVADDVASNDLATLLRNPRARFALAARFMTSGLHFDRWPLLRKRRFDL
jgi:hypothetical protein